MICNHIRRGAIKSLKTSTIDPFMKGAMSTHVTNPSLFHTTITSTPQVQSFSNYVDSKRSNIFSSLSTNQQYHYPLSARCFSTSVDTKLAAQEDVQPVEGMNNQNAFKALTPEVADYIRAEFHSVDANSDGRMDANEFKHLLRKHKNIFSEKEILEIAELFYVGNAGKSIPFDKLLDAIDRLAAEPKDGRTTKKNPLGVGSCAAEYYYDLNHHQWKKDQLDIELRHIQPQTMLDKVALGAVKAVRLGFDSATGWNGEINKRKVLQRVIFLETIAAVPGMTAAIIRHFKSLRSMERDGGLINMFLEEATNERMHLLTFVNMKDPSLVFRAAVIGSQFGFGSMFLLAYLISPKFCHRFVGYIEEEACSTYTKIIDAIETAPEGSELAQWRTERAPKIGISYWHLGENGTVLDLMYAVRADEAEHRDVNHSVVEMKPGDVNPRYDVSSRLDQALKTYVREMMTRTTKPE